MIETMKKAALEAGKILRSYYGNSLHTEKKGYKGLVTEADKKSEEVILSVLTKSFDFDVYAEESGKKENNSDYCWIIDPLDGTTNFTMGLPLFCISIGLFKQNKPEAAVIYHPPSDDLYWAQNGKGAYCNNTKLNKIEYGSIAVSFDKGYGQANNDMYLSGMREVYKMIKEIRTYGTSALELAYLARGYFNGFIAYGDELYDVAAGILLARETGCVIKNWKGEEWQNNDPDLIVAPEQLCGQLVEYLDPLV